jgi:DNA-directed RNA polymerase subunit RPC12/RpoP
MLDNLVLFFYGVAMKNPALMEILEINPEAIDMAKVVFDVKCPECGWFGMREDCQYERCPDCGERVQKEIPD